MIHRCSVAPASNPMQIIATPEAYRDEASDPVWDIISMIIGETRRFIDQDENLEEKIKALIRGLIQKQYDRLGWNEIEGEPAADQKLRATIIGLGSYSEDRLSATARGKRLLTTKTILQAYPAKYGP